MDRLVEELLRPEAYPDEVTSVELIETHISYIFLTGLYAYKMKKPVDYGFLDFTTLENRRYYCHREVELNRRLSPEVYLGVAEVREEDGRYTVEGPGRTAECAVKMLQMPRERAMSVLLKQGQVYEDDVRGLADRIAAFHARAETSLEIARVGGLEAVRRNVEENVSQTERFIGVSLPRETFDDLVAYSRAFLMARKNVFFQRSVEGRVRDGHSDLHTSQVFLEKGNSIIGCIEFNDRFRYSDVADDIAFLAMDLDLHDRPDLSQLLVETYSKTSGDAGVRELLGFFKTYRAWVRGKMTSFRLEDPAVQGEAREEVVAAARDYFRLAHSYIREAFPHPALIVVAGLTGSRRSTVARDLAHRWDLVCVSSDVTGKTPAGAQPGDQPCQVVGEGVHSRDLSHRPYDAILEQAEGHLGAGRSVVLDATFRHAEERTRAVALAERMEVDLWLVECLQPREELKPRFNLRWRIGRPVFPGRRDLPHQQEGEWEPVEEVPAGRYLRLETSSVLQETMRSLLLRLYASLLVPSSDSALTPSSE